MPEILRYVGKKDNLDTAPVRPRDDQGIVPADFFRYINPCGFIDKGVTSMDKEVTGAIDLSAVKKYLKHQIINVFQVDLVA